MNRRFFLSQLSLAYGAVRISQVDSDPILSRNDSRPNTPEPVLGTTAKTASTKSQLFRLSELRLLPGPFATQQEVNREYLHKLEPDRLLSGFRLEAGLEPKAPPYRGWESERRPALWGHILGFYLSGAGMMVQATSDPVLKSRLSYLTKELAEVQRANGSGCLLAVPGGKDLFAEIAKGNFEITHASDTYGSEINNVFEPTYTWNKITLGLYQSYLATGDPETRAVLIKTADWFGMDVLDHLSDSQTQRLLFCEHGSIHESMLNVFMLTSDPKYLRWARKLCFERLLSPLANGDTSFITGYHANCSIPVYTGFERLYQVSGEDQLHRAAINFLEDVIDNRSWANGGNSANEHFFSPADFEKAMRSPAGPESCNSVNMLRLIEAVYTTAPATKLLDHYERILWNHLLTTHEPNRGTFVYYTPMRIGTYRVYSDEFDSMWCCVGTGLESPGKYAQLIYAHSLDRKTLDVNFFIASTLSSDGLEIRQETTFPEMGRTTIVVERATHGLETIRVRCPRWISEKEMSVHLNGRALSNVPVADGYFVIARNWRKSDRLELSFPMHLSAEPLPHSKRYAALFVGPILLSAELGIEGLQKQDFWQTNATRPTKLDYPEEHFVQLNASTIEELARSVRPVGSHAPLQFSLKGGGGDHDLSLIPMYKNHHQRYAVYLKLRESSEQGTSPTRKTG